MIFLTQGPMDAKKELKQDMIKKCVRADVGKEPQWRTC